MFVYPPTFMSYICFPAKNLALFFFSGATLEKEKSTNIYEPVTNPAKEMMKPLKSEAESDSVSSGTQLTSFANPVYGGIFFL